MFKQFQVCYEDSDMSEVYATFDEAMEHLNKIVARKMYEWVQIRDRNDEDSDCMYEWNNEADDNDDDDISVLDEADYPFALIRQPSVCDIRIQSEFQKLLGSKYRVEKQTKDECGYTCDFVIIQGGCPMRYDKKQGWVNCDKCILNYDCNHCGSNEFEDLLKLYNCKGEWLEGGVFGVWIKK